MNDVRRSLLTVTLALITGLCRTASSTTINPGDFAPALQAGKFVQGEPVESFSPGKVYLVEFWATWCGPCRAAIPHLNQIHNKFKDKGLIIIGQDCRESDESKVVPFIQSMGDNMTYRVALDDKAGGSKGKMAEDWLTTAGRTGIPTAFLIDTTGRVAWIGQPMNLTDNIIENVLAGTFDIKEGAAEQAKEDALVQPISKKFQTAMQAKDWDTALNDLDELAKVSPAGAADHLSILRFKVLASKKDYSAAFAVIRQFGDSHKDEPIMQNDLAWLIVSDKSLEHPDLDLAQKLAQRALDEAREPVYKAKFLETMARVKYMQGSKEEAIAFEQKAVALAGADEKDKLQKTLEGYNKGQLPGTD